MLQIDNMLIGPAWGDGQSVMVPNLHIAFGGRIRVTQLAIMGCYFEYVDGKLSIIL